jgi:hypothetical protein
MTSRANDRIAENFTVHLADDAQQPPYEIHRGDELSDQHREDDLRKMLFDDSPELLQSVDSPPTSRFLSHPYYTSNAGSEA